MPDNPALELALYNAVREFIMQDGNAAVWEATVMPIIRRMGIQGAIALSNTGLYAEGVLLTDAEVLAAEAAGATALPVILRRLGISAVSSIKPVPPVVIAVVMGVSLLATTQQAIAAGRTVSKSNRDAYKEYILAYMSYIERCASMGGHIERFPPPMLYKQWLKRDTSGAWWQG